MSQAQKTSIDLCTSHSRYRAHYHPVYVLPNGDVMCQPIHMTLDPPPPPTGRRGRSIAFLGWLAYPQTDSAHTHTPLARVHAHCVSSTPRKYLRQYTPFPTPWQTPGGCLNAPHHQRAPNTGTRRSHLAPFSLVLRSSVTGTSGSATRARAVWCSAPL